MAGAGRNQLRRIRTTPVTINQRMKASSAGVDVPPGGNQAQTKFAPPITRPIQASQAGNARERTADNDDGIKNIAIPVHAIGVSALETSKNATASAGCR
jgi:hypothetical protein